MFLSSQVLFLFTETPLHAGSGMSLGVVDLPIQRERSTGYPLIQASGLKGALRSTVVAGVPDAEIFAVFGPDPASVTQLDLAEESPGSASEVPTTTLYAGALSPGDARLLLFPVRSLSGVFAWVTSLDVLQHFQRDVKRTGVQDFPALPTEEPATNEAYVSGSIVSAGGEVVLEEYAFRISANDEAQTRARELAGWLSAHALPQQDAYQYWRDKLHGSLVILPQNAYRDFVLYATEIVTRIRLEAETKTVAQGALWTEEHLPADCLLYAPIHATRLRTDRERRPEALAHSDPQQEAQNVLEWVSDGQHIPHWIQIGGDETLGRGLVNLHWLGGKA